MKEINYYIKNKNLDNILKNYIQKYDMILKNNKRRNLTFLLLFK